MARRNRRIARPLIWKDSSRADQLVRWPLRTVDFACHAIRLNPMKAILSLMLVAAIGVGVYWYLNRPREHPVLHQADELARAAERVKDSIQEKLGRFSLNGEDIKKELERTGKVVRQKVREVSAALADATADARITAAIKGKLVIDPDLSALSMTVNTTAGVVTLSGSVSSHEHIGKAMLLALEVEGVREVISTLQVKAVK